MHCPDREDDVVYYEKDDEREVKWYATKILNDNGAKHPVWLLQEPTGWGNHTPISRNSRVRIYR